MTVDFKKILYVGSYSTPGVVGICYAIIDVKMTSERRSPGIAERRGIEEAVEIVSLFTGGLSFEEVEKRLRISRSTIYRRLRLFGSQGGSLISNYAKYEWERASQLEEQLTGLYGLESVRVWDLPVRLSCPELYKRNENSALHEVLAKEAAKHLADILKSGQCLGVGGGEAAFQVAIHLTKLEPSQEQVRVLPLYNGPPSNLTEIGRMVASPNSVAYTVSTAFQKQGFPNAEAKLASPQFFRSKRIEEESGGGKGRAVGTETFEKWPWEEETPEVAFFEIGNVCNTYHHILINSQLESLGDSPLATSR